MLGMMTEFSAIVKDLKNARMWSSSYLHLMHQFGPLQNVDSLVDDSRLLQTQPNSDISVVAMSHTLSLLEKNDMALCT